MFRTGTLTTKTNRNKPKKSPKNIYPTNLYWGVLETINFFWVRTETNRNSTCLILFRFVFSQNQAKFFLFCFGVSDQYRNNQNKQNLWYGELKRFIFEQISCCFSWSFVCFGCFETPKLPVLILKRNNRNKHLVSYSAETSSGSSFGCFDTKLVSEDTLLWNNRDDDKL
jgi:hypothetical protein